MTNKQLLARAQEILAQGIFDIPAHLKGHGEIGNFLDELFGNRRDNVDAADTRAAELKFHDLKKRCLITLTRKEPDVIGTINGLVAEHGYIGRNKRRSFRHTVGAAKMTNRGFIGCLEDEGYAVYRYGERKAFWPQNVWVNVLFGKCRRLLVFHGVRLPNRRVHFQSATFYRELKLDAVKSAFRIGDMKIDFDATTNANGSIRSHGTKLRIALGHVQPLYQHAYDVTAASVSRVV